MMFHRQKRPLLFADYRSRCVVMMERILSYSIFQLNFALIKIHDGKALSWFFASDSYFMISSKSAYFMHATC